jgi:ferredoxin
LAPTEINLRAASTMEPHSNAKREVVLQHRDLQRLFDALKKKGYRVIGPTILGSAIVYEEMTSIDDLPKGWEDEQNGGSYRLKRRDDEASFSYVVGPHTWKQFLHLPSVRFWQARLDESGFQVTQEKEVGANYAFLGVRPCELHAIGIQDKVLLDGKYTDPLYKLQRANTFIVAVNCARAGGTCFCTSMDTGPKATTGFDLALTEVIDVDDSNHHYYVVEIGSDRGAEVLAEVPCVDADQRNREVADRISERTATQMGRAMDTTDIKELLYQNYDHSRWDDVADRCLNCANCTAVCPTCFCTTVEDATDLSGSTAERWRKWDSCFTMDFSYIHGGSIRRSAKARYRQWMMHKLATWIDQFGTTGCVGCGRCITWCPVGIDITEELRAIRSNETDENANSSAKENENGNS